jgi:hypothetical protein
MTPEERAHALLELAAYTGVDVSSDFLKKTDEHYPQAGIARIHPLIEGIYKPGGDRYAFCIWSQSALVQGKEIYPDEIEHRDDGSWALHYSAKNASLDIEPNRSLFACLKDKVPVLVIARSTPVDAPRVLYRILGPAILESFDASTNRFTMQGASSLLLDNVSRYSSIDQAVLLDIRSRLILPFDIGSVRQSYVTDRAVRDRVFRKIILDEYRGQCVVCQSKFLLREDGKDPLIEADAAHIISVVDSGPDDPRNGLSFCKRHHWAFDSGLFTITDGQTIKVSPSVLRAERRRFDLEEYDREPLIGPAHEICRPHEDALHWHQKRKFKQA